MKIYFASSLEGGEDFGLFHAAACNRLLSYFFIRNERKTFLRDYLLLGKRVSIIKNKVLEIKDESFSGNLGGRQSGTGTIPSGKQA